MPWTETCAMDERIRFVVEYDQDELSMTQLCAKYGISRKTGYKWLARAAQVGLDHLHDRSRRPQRCPGQTPPEVERAVLTLRASHPTWGPKKLLRRLQDSDGQVAWPARSTIAQILHRHGLAMTRKRRHVATPSRQPLAHCDQANAVWCIDFKGWFRTGDGCRCDPLTVSDGYSRYLLRCQAVDKTSALGVGPVLEAAFRQYGLPRAIRSDNGPPFASCSLQGLTKLNIWWLKLGIVHERIEAGQPQQNGRHERMHLTLKQETCLPAAGTLRAQQRRFDQFVEMFNHQRPHEALGLDTPAMHYAPSPRAYPARLEELTYPSAWLCRQVRLNGEVKFQGSTFYLSQALAGEPVGLEPVDGRHWRVHVGGLALGILDEGSQRLLRPRELTRRGLTVRPATGTPPSAALQEASQSVDEVLPMSPD
jgi:putative transposase